MDELFIEYSPLIYSVARKFYNVEKEDLYQAGCLGLSKALKNYNDSNVKFSSYAYKYIFGEMYELSLRTRDIKLNKYYLKLYKLINQYKSILAQTLCREVTLQDISEYSNIDITELEYASMLTEEMFSLDDEYEHIQVGTVDAFDDMIMLEDSINNLDPLSSAVINYRYKEDLTQQEVASLLGISQVKVSRIEAASKQKILEYIS